MGQLYSRGSLTAQPLWEFSLIFTLSRLSMTDRELKPSRQENTASFRRTEWQFYAESVTSIYFDCLKAKLRVKSPIFLA